MRDSATRVQNWEMSPADYGLAVETFLLFISGTERYQTAMFTDTVSQNDKDVNFASESTCS